MPQSPALTKLVGQQGARSQLYLDMDEHGLDKVAEEEGGHRREEGRVQPVDSVCMSRLSTEEMAVRK